MESDLSNFKPLKLTKDFEAAGFTRQQSESITEPLSELANVHTVTKSYFDKRVDKLEVRIDNLEFKIRESEHKMTIKLGTMMVVMVGVISAVVKLL